MKNQFSVVLTFYNESPNIEELVRKIEQSVPKESEIVLIDDMSEDGSWEIVQNLQSTSVKLSAYRNKERIGLGPSILQGILRANYESVILMDSDLTHNPLDLPRLIHAFQWHELVIGSRHINGGGMEPKHLYFSSKIYSQVLRFYLRIPIRDPLGGFLVMNRRSFTKVLNNVYFRGFGEFSIALCLFAHLSAISSIEIPVQFQKRNSGTRKSKRFKMILNYAKSSRHFNRLMRRET